MIKSRLFKTSFVYTSLMFCSFISSGYRIPDIIPRPPPLPFTHIPEKEVNQSQIDRLESLEDKTPEEFYRLGLYYILAGNLNQAVIYLDQALEKDPEFLEALIQLGYVYLWQNNQTLALEYFEKALDSKKCDKRALNGLFEVAPHLKDHEAIGLYERLLKCEPKNQDLIFELAILYKRTNQLAKAEKLLLDLLDKNPENLDAIEALASIYNQQNDVDALNDLYRRYPQNAQLQYIYAKRLLNDEKFTEAKKIYEKIPKSYQVYKELYEIKSRTDPSVFIDANYTDAKEWDPTLNIPVVKDYYFSFGANALLPITDKGRIDLRAFEYHQRENQINQPVGVNYSVYEAGGQIKGHYYFLPNWRLDLSAKGYQAWGLSQAKYPFQKANILEAGVNLVLNSTHLFVADAHLEHFIIKNYNKGISQLLRTDYVQGIYGYRPDIYMHPIIEGLAGAVYYHDHFNNIKNMQYLKGGFDLFTPYLKTYYLFEHSTFKYLNQNYFSYKMQTRSTVDVRFQKEIKSNLLWELIWDHTWELTKNLYLPIGDTVYVASRLYLIWNTYTAKMTFRHKDKLKIELSGHSDFIWYGLSVFS
jgi:Tfp pilus assembly protein PilF